MNQSILGGWDSANGPVSPRRNRLREWTRTLSIFALVSNAQSNWNENTELTKFPYGYMLPKYKGRRSYFPYFLRSQSGVHP